MTFNEKEYIQDFINKYSLKCEEIAESELAEIILQMIKSGDILRLVTPVDFKTNENDYNITANVGMKFIYKPFRKAEEIKKDLRNALKEIKNLYAITRKEAIKEYERGGGVYYDHTSGQAHGIAESIDIIEGVLEKHETNN
jgi:predicted RNA-binding protein with PUA domain